MIATETVRPTIEGAADRLRELPFKALFDSAPAAIAVFQGRDHQYVYANAAYDALAGEGVRLGRMLKEVCADRTGLLLQLQLDQVFTTGEPLEVPEFEIAMDGAQRGKIVLRQVLQPWRDEAGAVAGVMSFAFDVTEQVGARLKAEEAERHLSFALEMGDGIGTYDWDTRRDSIVVDERFLSAFGLDPARALEQLPLEEFLNSIHEGDRERVAIAVRHAVATGEEYEEEYRLRGDLGADRHVLARGRCLRDAHGQPDHFTGVVIDISKQRRDQLALRDSEARLRSVLVSLDQGYCEAEMIRDADGQPVDYRFIDVNPKFEEMTGLKDAVGRTALELVPNLEAKWAQAYGRVAYEGAALRFEDGSEAMGRWFDVFATPVLPYGRFALVFRDVTAEKRTQEALRKREAEFRTITEAMPQIVWSTRPDGYHDFYNARWYEFTGMPEGSTDGEGWSDIFHPDDQEEAWSRWRHSLETGELYEIEYRLRHHSGAYHWVLGRAQPVRNAEGDIVRWLGTCTDIHDLKLADEQRQLMLGEMNHRVKNILAMVNATVTQTMRQADNLQDARQSIQSRISAMARAHDQLVNATWTQTRIMEVVKTALAPHRTGEGRFRISGPDIPIASKQALALTMALHELATNAVKYGSLSITGGRVAIVWSIQEVDGAEQFTLTWSESEGPSVVAPTRNGFGSMMIEQALPAYFSGTAELCYAASGLSFELKAPLAGLEDYAALAD